MQSLISNIKYFTIFYKKMKVYKHSKTYLVTIVIISILLTFLRWLGIVVFLYFFGLYRSEKITINKNSITVEKWLLVKDEHEIPLDKINSVSINWGENIRISIGNDSIIKFDWMQNAKEFKENIMKLK